MMRPIFSLLFALILLPVVALAENGITNFKLDNGMEVVVVEDHRVPVVTHMVWYKVGAADEPWGQSGVAHFFEHLMFKGTEKIAPGQFSRIVAQNGGQDNAFTSQDYTAYFQRIAADRLDMVMEMEADRMKNLKLDEQNVATERQVVLEERNQRVENNPSALFGEQLDAAFYRNHPYAIPVIGWRSEIADLTKEEALDFYQKYYAPDQAILVVAGDVTPERVRELAEKHYAPLKASGAKRPTRPQEPEQTKAVRQKITLEDERVGQPYVIQSYLVPSMVEDLKQAAALDLLAQLLDGDATGMLYAALEDQGVAIDTGAYYRGMTIDKTEFSVYGVPSPQTDLQTVQDTFERVVKSLHTDLVDAEDLERAKQVFLNDLIYQKDSQVSLANMYGMALAVGLSVADVQGWQDVIQSITPEDIQTVAKAYLDPSRSTTGWLLNKEGTP